MRVGLVCPFSLDVPGGVQAHVMELAAELMRRGHEVRVLAPASQTLALPFQSLSRRGPRAHRALCHRPSHAGPEGDRVN